MIAARVSEQLSAVTMIAVQGGGLVAPCRLHATQVGFAADTTGAVPGTETPLNGMLA